MPTSPSNLVDLGAIGSTKMVLQTHAGPFSQNRLLLSLTPSSAVVNNCRRTRAAGSSAEGSPRACPEWRAICLYEAAAESACRQYRAVRWFLLPGAELAAAGSGQQTRHCHRRAISSTSRLFSPARDAYGSRRQKAARLHIWLNGLSSGGLHITPER